MTPRDLRRAMRTPPERWRVQQDGRARRASTSPVLQSILSHPVLAFGKGQRPLDSRLPRGCRRPCRSCSATGRVRGHGAGGQPGDTRWLRGGDEPGRVRLGPAHDPGAAPARPDFARAELPADVPAGRERGGRSWT